jgi:DNA-binding NarL/FixJ family response regulator
VTPSTPTADNGNHPGPTVAIVDDHELLVHTVTLALASSSIRCVPVSPQQTAQLLEALTALAPTAVLLDLDLGPFGDATPLIAPLTDSGIRVVALTGQTDHIRLARALEGGAAGIQSKSAGFEELVATARAVVAGAAVHPETTAALLGELAAHRRRRAAELSPFHALTDREQATLRELADGRTVQQIARTWVVSTATVRSHVQAILRKLDAGSQLQAVAAARRSGWLDGTPTLLPAEGHAIRTG